MQMETILYQADTVLVTETDTTNTTLTDWLLLWNYATENGDIFAEHYQLKKLLGVGSFGEVWLARNILADVDVAIKLYGLLDDNGIKDFREEFKLAYKLHHPNLLHLNHFDVLDSALFGNALLSQRVLSELERQNVWKANLALHTRCIMRIDVSS